VENFLGVHRLVALPPVPTDSDWTPAEEYDPTRPRRLDRVCERLRASGLTVGTSYAVFPGPTSPSVLLSAEILADDRIAGFLEATVARACVPLDEVLADPGRLAVRTVRHGATADLAPAWILTARRADATAQAAGGREAVIATGSLRREIDRAADSRWTDTAGEPVPTGPTLQSLIIGACLRRDLPAIRDLLTAWQAAPVAGVPADQVIVEPTGALTGPPSILTGLVEPGTPGDALRALATELLDGGVAHPWPVPPDSVADLTAILAAMAGTDDAETGSAEPPEKHDRVLHDVIVERDRLRRELAEAEAAVRWYEESLDARQTALDQARRTIELLSGTGPARLGMAMMGGARAARRSVRGLARVARDVRRR
jgi:hypothetical protein